MISRPTAEFCAEVKTVNEEKEKAFHRLISKSRTKHYFAYNHFNMSFLNKAVGSISETRMGILSEWSLRLALAFYFLVMGYQK